MRERGKERCDDALPLFFLLVFVFEKEKIYNNCGAIKDIEGMPQMWCPHPKRIWLQQNNLFKVPKEGKRARKHSRLKEEMIRE